MAMEGAPSPTRAPPKWPAAPHRETKRTHKTRGSTQNQRTQRTKRTRSNQMNRDAPGQHARGTHAAAQNGRTVRQMRAHAKQHGERADTHRTPRGAESAMHSQLEHTGGSGRKGLSCGGCARPRVRARARTHRPRKHVRRRTGKQQGTAVQHQHVGTKRTIWSTRQCTTAQPRGAP